ncbi:VWA domain-containing protein [Vibrio sp. J1-1]|uniref:VWA domain-containing protein n=1 Tax=Vibrio sp. J1-1 TaxID=2912251 RepID=UPI001F27CE08|nr:VWA domain-containing protein [Vibrio sp. J1-1]MCF7482197.1 VWA domain-containing protein [Vibrio sp. J1-1]
MRSLSALPLSLHAQLGVVSVSAAIFLAGMLTFFSFVLLVVVTSTTDSRLSMLADAVLYSSSDSRSAQQDAEQLLNANVSDESTALSTPLTRLDNREKITNVTVTGKVQSSKLVLNDELHAGDLSILHQASSRLHQTTLEIVVMLDVSSSMKGMPMGLAIKGLRDFADILYAQERRNLSKTISIVPATGYINIGWRPNFLKTSALAFPRGLRPLAKEQGWSNLLSAGVPGRWRGAMCMQLPENQDGLTHAGAITPDWTRRLELGPEQQNLRFKLESQIKPPIERYENGMPLHEYYSSENSDPYNPKWKHLLGLFDSADCGASSIQAFMSNHREFVNGLKTIYPEMNTNNAEGVMWAWRLLSPEWRGLWDKTKRELPRDYGLDTNKKVMVLFTDGDHLAEPVMRDKKQVALCREMKRKGIEIIAVDFNNRSPAMKSCASPGQYYQATNRTIRTVLQQVATTLNKIELVE